LGVLAQQQDQRVGAEKCRQRAERNGVEQRGSGPDEVQKEKTAAWEQEAKEKAAPLTTHV